MLQLDRNCNHATRTTAEIHIATSQGMKGGTVKLTSSSFCLLLFQRPDPCVFAGPSAHLISVVTLGYILATPQCQASSGAMFKWLTADRDKGTRAFASVAEGLQSLYKDWLVVAKYLLPKRM